MKQIPARRYYRNQKWLKQIGTNIRKARIDRNISQPVLASKCKVDNSQINRMELGKVNFSVSYLYKIAQVLRIHPKELLP
jgi:transcriptional regulator with XRE-family HTH domain